jgi:hypothetical protein
MICRLVASWFIVWVAVGVASATSVERLSGDQAPAQLLALARAAIGGEAKLASVKSIRFAADAQSWNQSFGRHPDAKQEYLDKKVEIQALWPDRFLRTRTTVLPDGRTAPPFQSGFVGAVNVGGTVVGNQERLDFARWMLLFLLRIDTAVPLTLRPNLNQHGELQFDGPLNLQCSIALDPTTHAPVSLRTPVKRAGPDGLPGTETIREIVFSAESRREINGLRVPDHLVMRDANKKVLEQYWLRNIELNPPLTPADFKR